MQETQTKGVTRRPKWATQAVSRSLADTTRPVNSSTSKIHHPDLGTIRSSIKDELGLAFYHDRPLLVNTNIKTEKQFGQPPVKK